MVSVISKRHLFIYLTARSGGSEDSEVYTPWIEFAQEVFRTSEPNLYCGEMIMTIENDYTFLTFDEASETVFLRPTFGDPNGKHNQARIRFQMSRALYSLNFAVTVHATISLCVVDLLGFKISQFTVTFYIGAED